MNQTLHRNPFLRLSLPFIAGIIGQYQYGGVILCWLSVTVALLILSVWLILKERYERRWIFGLFVGMFCFASGCFVMRMALRETEWEQAPGKSYYTAVLEEYPLEKKRSFMCRLRLKESGKRVVVYLSKDSLSAALMPGQMLHFHTRLEALENTEDAADFDYKQYLRKQGYAATAYVAPGDWTAGIRCFGLKYKAQECQRYLASILGEAGLSERAYAFGTTMLLGYRELMEDDINRSFSVSGISHVISVSGMHTQVIFMTFLFLFGFLGNSRRSRTVRHVTILLFLWVFTFVSGLSPPVVRASLMLTFYGLADIVGKQALNLNVVSASAFLMLLYNPFYLFDISFQLTYLAVLSLVVVYPRLEGLHITVNPIVRYLWTAFCISVSAQLATAPLCIYYFHQFPCYFWLANVVIAPLVGPALIGMILILLVHPLFSLPAWCYHPVGWMLEAIISTAEAVEMLPGALIGEIECDARQTLLWYGILLSLFVYGCSKKVKYLYCF